MPFLKLTNLPSKEIFKGSSGRFVHGDKMTIAYWEFEAGTILPEHSHPHEQIAMMLEGKFELTIDGETQILEAGMVAVIPSQAVHSGKFITYCKIIDAFAPVREDYL